MVAILCVLFFVVAVAIEAIKEKTNGGRNNIRNSGGKSL